VTLTGRLPPLAPRDVPEGTLGRVNALLADPAAWLPASAWEDRAIRAYVPSHYAICFGNGIDSPASSLLPPAAQDLLRGKDTAYQPLLVKPLNWNGSSWPQLAVCSELTTTEARALASILSSAGFHSERTWMNTDAFWSGKHDENHPEPPDAWIEFNPILPHGQPRGMLG
jgi:hypothetical protein